MSEQATSNSPLKTLCRLIELDRSKSLWMRAQTTKDWAGYLADEQQEFVEALDKGSPHDIVNEAGDLLITVLATVIVAEDEGKFSLDDACLAALRKIANRKPWLLEDTHLTLDEEIECYQANKRREKLEQSHGEPCASMDLQAFYDILR